MTARPDISPREALECAYEELVLSMLEELEAAHPRAVRDSQRRTRACLERIRMILTEVRNRAKALN